jgi:hypothetical protein
MTFSQFAGVLVNLSPLTWLIIVAPFLAFLFAGAAGGRFGDWYRIDWKARRLERRWYCTRSRVRVREARPGLIWEVEGWQQHESGAIVLLLATLDSETRPVYWWVPLENALPLQMPALHPHLDHGFPRLTRYVPAGAA